MRLAARQGAALAVLAALLFTAPSTPALAFAARVVTSNAQVWVAGRQIPFDHLGIAYGDPVAPVDDAGTNAMLASVDAKASWEPGTRFVAITRADGQLITFTLGSNAVSIEGVPSPMPFAPFADGSRLYLPLLPLARALNLAVRGFRGGYVFVPQITSVAPRAEPHRTVIAISGSAPLAWHASITGRGQARTLTLTFAGFGTDATGTQLIRNASAGDVKVAQSGPPGYPTTTVSVTLKGRAEYAAHRLGVGGDMELIIAANAAALRVATVPSGPSAVQLQRSPAPAPPTPRTKTPAPQPSPTQPPAPSPTPAIESPAPGPTALPSGASPAPSESPGAQPTAQPLGPGAAEQGTSPSPSASGALAVPQLAEQKITDVAVQQTAAGTRLMLAVTGPVAFEWHRLADPDNRYWLDIHGATLVGPARTLQSTLPFVKEIKVSQHLLVPEKIVRVSIMPTQAIDVRVGAIEGLPNQLGVDIESQPPQPDAPASGTGMLSTPVPSGSASPVEPAPRQPDLIVIDPGHGGNDPGSLNEAYGLVESKLTLDISLRLAADLRRKGWRVVLTRDGDYEVGDPVGPDQQELQARCDVANAAGARLFISVHINSSVSSDPNGATTYYWRAQDRKLAEAVQSATVGVAGISDDGVKRQNFWVIHHTVMPAILVETAYLSNPHDAELLRRSWFLDKLAAGIARGIDDYAGGPLAPVGQARPPRASQS